MHNLLKSTIQTIVNCKTIDIIYVLLNKLTQIIPEEAQLTP